MSISRREALLGGVAAVLVSPFKASAESFENSSYFGFEFLKETGSILHGGKSAEELAQSFDASVYEPTAIAAAFAQVWNDASGDAKNRIVTAYKAEDLGPLTSFVTQGRRDQTVPDTIDDQFSRIAQEALRDVDNGNGTAGRSGFKQIADVGLQAALVIMNQAKESGDQARYEGLKEQYGDLTTHMAGQWQAGLALFTADLTASLEASASLPDVQVNPVVPRVTPVPAP